MYAYYIYTYGHVYSILNMLDNSFNYDRDDNCD